MDEIMGLHIYNSSGVDLAVQPPVPITMVTTANGAAAVSIQCSLVEDDPVLNDSVSGTIYWNDGSLPEVYSPTSGTLVINAAKNLPIGNYVIRVDAQNYIPPYGFTASANFNVSVVANQNVSTQPSVFLTGPILPKDDGYPNTVQWNWNSGNDLDILVSSVKMLLTTAKGERVMLPSYGTNLKSIVFSVGTSGIEGLVQQEIIDALSTWEPRVSLATVSVSQPTPTSVSVTATLVSKLNNSQFSLPLTFSL